MNSIVERLRSDTQSAEEEWALMDEAADLIEQQEQRIKELEAAMPLYDELLIRCAIAEKELTTLRNKIEDAPVVAWWNGKAGFALPWEKNDPSRFHFVDMCNTTLISKEDLK